MHAIIRLSGRGELHSPNNNGDVTGLHSPDNGKGELHSPNNIVTTELHSPDQRGVCKTPYYVHTPHPSLSLTHHRLFLAEWA